MKRNVIEDLFNKYFRKSDYTLIGSWTTADDPYRHYHCILKTSHPFPTMGRHIYYCFTSGCTLWHACWIGPLNVKDIV